MRLMEPAFEDLQRILKRDPQVVRAALKKMMLLEQEPEAGQPPHGGLAGWRKLVVGNRRWRVIWRVSHEECGRVVVDVAEVWAVGARKDAEVYREMAERVASLPTSPSTMALADVVERLARVGGVSISVPEPAAEVLPEWLTGNLTRVAGLPADTVAQMNLREAVDAWTEWMSRDSS